MKILKTLFVICIIVSTISAQPFGLNFNIHSYQVTSGVYQGQSEIYLAYSHNIINSGSPWMQVIFSDANFGTSSYVKLTLIKDKVSQKLNSITLNQWQNYSALKIVDAAREIRKVTRQLANVSTTSNEDYFEDLKMIVLPDEEMPEEIKIVTK